MKLNVCVCVCVCVCVVFFLRSLLFLNFIWTFFSHTLVIPVLLKTGFYSQKFLINKEFCPGEGFSLRVHGAQVAPEAADLLLGCCFFEVCVSAVLGLPCVGSSCGAQAFSSRRAQALE